MDTWNYFFAATAFAQTLQKWSPPDKSFSVKVASPLKEELDAYGHAPNADAVKAYGVEANRFTFMVVILRFAEYGSQSIEKKFGGLFFVVGGDDDHDFSKRNMK